MSINRHNCHSQILWCQSIVVPMGVLDYVSSRVLELAPLQVKVVAESGVGASRVAIASPGRPRISSETTTMPIDNSQDAELNSQSLWNLVH